MQSPSAIRPIAIQLMRLLVLCAIVVMPMKSHAEKFGDPTVDLGAARSTDHGEHLAGVEELLDYLQEIVVPAFTPEQAVRTFKDVSSCIRRTKVV